MAPLDALRGLALLGVLAVNGETEFRISIFRQFLPGKPEAGIDRLIEAALIFFFDMKAFAVLSMLFGAGLAIQFERLANVPDRILLLVRRLVVLLAFGLVHLFLIWNGDILAEYAVAGLVVLPFLFGPTWLMAAACASFLAFHTMQPLLPPLVPFPSQAWLVRQVAAANRFYATGSVAEVLSFRIAELEGFVPLHAAVLPRTLGLFLLGALAWRAGLIRQARRIIRPLLLVAALAAGVGLALTLAASARAWPGWPYLRWLGPVTQPAGTVLIALGYVSFVLAAGSTRTGRLWLAWAEPVGRMALTNYVLQSLVLGCVFYGYGLGLFGKLDLATGLGIVLAIYVAQVVGSSLWLRNHGHGPLEWLWRTLAYGQAPSARRP